MEKVTLKPQQNEIVVNNGALDGAVDVFSYAPDETSARELGSLYVMGYRETDSNNMEYTVSLIAALARREYYAQPNTPPREAFSRTLRKANEVVEEFFHANDVKLSIGIVAIAGGTILVSKLDKFKILLAREKQVIDIMDNVMLFSKDHSEKRRFSSVIHGSVYAGDRILAFVPTRAIAVRERNIKNWFLKMPQDEFSERIARIGEENATFATAMLHIHIAQEREPAETPSPQPPELTSPATSAPTPVLAWTPRQHSAPQITRDAGLEEPRIIPSEFSLGTRRTLLSRLLRRTKFIRLDRRGKAVALALASILVIGSSFAVKTFLFTSQQQKKEQQALENIQGDLELARSKITQNDTGEARSILFNALASINELHLANKYATTLTASLVSAMDDIDHAEQTTPTLIASPQPDASPIALAAWSSASHAIWVGGSADGTVWAAPLRDGIRESPIQLGVAHADILLGWRDSVVAVNFAERTIARMVNGTAETYTIPVQETLLDISEFGDSLYALTDKSILKISDLDTKKPVTKQWLTHTEDLNPNSAKIWVNGNIWTLGRDGTFATYYKGERTSQSSAPLTLSGSWRLVGAPNGLLAVAAGESRRIYLITSSGVPDGQADGSLIRTLKLDSEIPYSYISNGPDNSVLLITSEGKLWQVK